MALFKKIYKNYYVKNLAYFLLKIFWDFKTQMGPLDKKIKTK